MTAQLSDNLLFEGRTHQLNSDPLAPWLWRRKNRHIRFRRMNTARARGYGASWAIVGGRLYLTAFQARLPDGSPATMETLFEAYTAQFYASVKAHAPENAGPGRFAFWYSGTLVCPLGRQLAYQHYGYGGRWERELWLSVEDGYLFGSRIVENPDLSLAQI